MDCNGVQRRGKKESSAMTLLRRFSSIKVDFEKERRKTITRYQQQGLQISVTTPKCMMDKREVSKLLRASIERYSLPELYVKMICALFPQVKMREMPDSNALIRHLKQVFRLSDNEHSRLMDIARNTKLPQRIVNLEIVEARNIPAKDPNGLSDPVCIVFVNSRDTAQRTKVVGKTLNPVWKQYFTFKVNDQQKDVLYFDVMDQNDQDESLKDRLRRFRDIKSPGNLPILLKEIANARSPQELIGTVKLPVAEISSETIERWYKLKNTEDRGEIYLRMALGYNKSKDAATEEFLQIVHFLLVHELDKETSLPSPFYWDEHYEMWSKYILRQFKWQGGLKPKDIVLAKWRAYTVVNAIYPLNANMMCLLMDAVFERALNGEYDARELTRLWDCTERLVNTIVNFLADLHDVLPCPVTVLHTYHMLKTIELLNQFIQQPSNSDRGTIPFTENEIVERVTKAVREGADKFYLKVFSDSTYKEISADQDPMNFALDRLLGMGQILHEDIRLGLSTVDTDFKGILGVDYQTITYKVYDEEFGKMVKYIVQDYNSTLLETNDGEVEDDESLDENSPSVITGLAVLKLYMSAKNIADQAPPHYLEKQTTSEFSLKKGYHDWFFHSVATWIDILKRKVIKLVKNSVKISENESLSVDGTDSFLSKVDTQSSKDVPISPSAIDTAQLFLGINTFWTSLGWENPHQSYVIVRKITEELYGSLIYYAAQLREKMKSQKPSIETGFKDDDPVHAYLHKGCVEINNINYVKEHVELLAQQLKISEIIEKIELTEANAVENGEYNESIDTMKSQMEDEVQKVVADIMRNCVKIVTPKFQNLLLELSSEEISKESGDQAIYSSQRFKQLMNYVDTCLVIMTENLETPNFCQLLTDLWESFIGQVDDGVNVALETGKTSDYFHREQLILIDLHALFWDQNSKKLNMEIWQENPSVLSKYEELKDKLASLECSVEKLKGDYYSKRYKRQQATKSATNEHGIVTIRACFVEKKSAFVVEILNARKLKSYDSNNSSDPYAMATFVPKESFPTTPSHSTKYHRETLFPLFEETFTFTLKEEERSNGFLMIVLYDYDYIGRDDLMGEAFVPLQDVSKVPSVSDIGTLPQLHLALTKPEASDLECLQRFEERLWDKEAAKFAKAEKEKMQV